MRCAIAHTPDARGMEFAASALHIIEPVTNCRHAILIKIPKRPTIVPLKIIFRTWDIWGKDNH